MMESNDLIERIADLLALGRFEGKGRNWRLDAEGGEVVWLLQMEKVPRIHSVGMYLGADLPCVLEGPRPARGNDCSFVLHPDSHRSVAGIDPTRFRPALNLDTDMSDVVRMQQIEEGVSRIIHFVKTHRTLADLGAAYRRGEFRGAPITVKLQEILAAAGA